MQNVCFHPFRGRGIPDTSYIKSEHFFKEIDRIKEADWVIFPEYWQVNALVYGLEKRIFPSISAYHLGHDKVEMTRALMSIMPEVVPYTEILSNTEINQEYILDTFYFPFVGKEVRNSCGNGVHLIKNKQDFKNYCVQNDVLYVQEYLPIDRDMRIVYVGDEVVCGYWRIGAEGSFKNNVAAGGSISFDPISVKAMNLVHSVAGKLGINHAGFDVAVVDDQYYIFEFNIMFGLQGIHALNINLDQKIYEYLIKQSSPDRPFVHFTGKKIG
ncbi:MAG: hypothetical protein PWP27_909 [Clostridiales bacterium]|jgi:ribosomal protein S6--L-glutamate ligase|nr:hypothetical protein [Clostridiales bacterium]MDK2933099.1 hypothetical protein [Clostridiales bacterium]